MAARKTLPLGQAPCFAFVLPWMVEERVSQRSGRGCWPVVCAAIGFFWAGSAEIGFQVFCGGVASPQGCHVYAVSAGLGGLPQNLDKEPGNKSQYDSDRAGSVQ